MKNEIMARAITEIDDDIIAEACDNVVPFRKKRSARAVFFAAACIALVAVSSLMLAQRVNTPVILAYGNVMTDEPVNAGTAAAGKSVGASSDESVLSIPLEVRRGKEVKLSADGGTLDVSHAKSGELLYSGTLCSVKAPVLIEWTVTNPDTEKSYSLSINDGSAVITLMYDNETENWFIIKTQQ